MKDLRALMGIQVTDYTYRDTVTKGSAPQKKAIAQQVEKVYPSAVSRSTDVVPDIFKKATAKDGWVQLATDLKRGDRVRLLGGKTEGIHEVLEVRADAFRTDFREVGEIFVYGREVNDFRSVDYEAIAMLNVSATQQIKKDTDTLLKALREENAGLRAKLESQEQRLAAVEASDAKLAKLVKLLEQKTVTVALQKP